MTYVYRLRRPSKAKPMAATSNNGNRLRFGFSNASSGAAFQGDGAAGDLIVCGCTRSRYPPLGIVWMYRGSLGLSAKIFLSSEIDLVSTSSVTNVSAQTVRISFSLETTSLA